MKQTTRKASTAAVEAAILFWELARIPIRAKKHFITKVEKLHEKWKSLMKTRNQQGEKQRHDEASFLKYLDNLFDMTAQDALQVMKIEEDKQFLLAQQEEGCHGRMGGVDKTLADKEKRAEKRKSSQANYNIALERNPAHHMLTETRSNSVLQVVSKLMKNIPTFLIQSFQIQKSHDQLKKLKNIMTSGLAAALDRTGVSDRNAVYILSAAFASVG